MDFLDTIFVIVWKIADTFFDAADMTATWWTPFNLIQYPLYVIAKGFRSLATPIAQTGDWIRDAAGKISNLLTWESIYDLILIWFPGLKTVVDWFQDVYWNVYHVVSDWWLGTYEIVKGWIASVVQGWNDLLDQVKSWIGDLEESWDNFWTGTWPQWTGKLDSLAATIGDFFSGILPTLADFFSVQNLIDSTLKSWFPFYNVLSAIIDIAGEFFGSPFDWLLDRFEDWFWGEEE